MTTAKRYREAEEIAEATRAELPAAALAWLAALREPLEKLTRAALSGEVDDAEFRRLAEEFQASLPGMMDRLDHDALGDLMERGMGAAMGNGIAQRMEDSAGATVRAKLPREGNALLG